MTAIERLLKRNEIQTYLGISKDQFWRYVREKPHFRTMKFGKHRVMRESALEDFIRKEEDIVNA